MSNEVNIQSSIIVRSGNLNHSSQPTGFRGNMSSVNAFLPGGIVATLAGTKVQFPTLVQPGYCYINNLDSTNFITYGIWYHDGSIFLPLGEVLPGEIYVLRLSRYLQAELGTGTGTDHSLGNRLMVKADTAPCNVVVVAFDN